MLASAAMRVSSSAPRGSTQRIKVIAGDQALSREFSEQAYQLAAEPKQLVVVPGAGHVDLYDRTDGAGRRLLDAAGSRALGNVHP